MTGRSAVAFLIVLVAGACSPEPAPPAGTPTPVEWAAEVPTASSLDEPTCPEPSDDNLLLRNEAMGYCLLYPQGLMEITSSPEALCLIPEGPAMGCHNMVAAVNVWAAEGRTASEYVEQVLAPTGGFGPERESAVVAGQAAVVLPEVHAQASTRELLFTFDDRLYHLSFVLPDPEDPAVQERYEDLYDSVVESFRLIPAGQAPASPMVDGVGPGTALVAYLHDGNILLWAQASGHSDTLDAGGDVIRLAWSPDGQELAFVRRAYFATADFDRHQMSSLWVMSRDGSNPRELVSAQQLRSDLGAAETDSTNFPRLAWIPGTHRLIYSGNTYQANGYGEGAHTPLRGVYLVDAQTSQSTTILDSDASVEFAVSPDGKHVSLVSTTGLSFWRTADGELAQDVLMFPAYGVPGSILRPANWAADSSAVLIHGEFQELSKILLRFPLWRVPVDGAPAELVGTFTSGSHQLLFAPDGSSAAYSRWAPGRQTGVEGEVSGIFLTPLPDNLGPLAVTQESLTLLWSPLGQAYLLKDLFFDAENVASGRDEMFPLCPRAAQIVETCGASIPFGQMIEFFEWIDNSNFLYVTYEPRQLYFGGVDGGRALLADDPGGFEALAASCADDSEFIADVTIPDGTELEPQDVFRKTWRLRNSGTCTWGHDYRLWFLSGDRMSGPRSLPLPQSVGPGEEIDLSVTLIAPPAPGSYQSHWQLLGPDGKPFGTRPFVQIQVR